MSYLWLTCTNLLIPYHYPINPSLLMFLSLLIPSSLYPTLIYRTPLRPLSPHYPPILLPSPTLPLSYSLSTFPYSYPHPPITPSPFPLSGQDWDVDLEEFAYYDLTADAAKTLSMTDADFTSQLKSKKSIARVLSTSNECIASPSKLWFMVSKIFYLLCDFFMFYTVNAFPHSYFVLSAFNFVHIFYYRLQQQFTDLRYRLLNYSSTLCGHTMSTPSPSIALLSLLSLPISPFSLTSFPYLLFFHASQSRGRKWEREYYTTH